MAGSSNLKPIINSDQASLSFPYTALCYLLSPFLELDGTAFSITCADTSLTVADHHFGLRYALPTPTRIDTLMREQRHLNELISASAP